MGRLEPPRLLLPWSPNEYPDTNKNSALTLSQFRSTMCLLRWFRCEVMSCTFAPTSPEHMVYSSSASRHAQVLWRFHKVEEAGFCLLPLNYWDTVSSFACAIWVPKVYNWQLKFSLRISSIWNQTHSVLRTVKAGPLVCYSTKYADTNKENKL